MLAVNCPMYNWNGIVRCDDHISLSILSVARAYGASTESFPIPRLFLFQLFAFAHLFHSRVGMLHQKVIPYRQRHLELSCATFTYWANDSTRSVQKYGINVRCRTFPRGTVCFNHFHLFSLVSFDVFAFYFFRLCIYACYSRVLPKPLLLIVLLFPNVSARLVYEARSFFICLPITWSDLHLYSMPYNNNTA